MTSSRITSSTNLNQHTDRSSDNTNGYLGTELSYEADSLNLISAQFNINGSRNTGNSSQVSLLNATLPQVYQLDNSSVGTGSGLDAALNYQLGFKKDKNRLLTFSYKYFTFNNDQDNELIVSNSSGYFDPNYKQNNNSLYREHTVQADYVLPVKKLTIEAGLKGIMRDNKSDFQFLSQASGGDFVPNASRTNVFNNTQQVYSAYNSYKYDLKKWGFRAGVRMENTVINANFVSSVSHVDQNYFNVVPSVSVNRRFKNQSSINLGFSQRIQRPGINQLNPFVDRSNPNFETTGNPDLRPSTGNAFQLGYTWTKKFNLNYGFGYYWINGLIFPVSAFNPATNITRTTFQNTGRAQMFGNSINISGSFSKKWAGSVNGNVNYGIADGISNGQPIKNQGLMYNVNVNSNIKFDKGWRLSGGVFFFSGSLTVQEKQKGFITTNFTVTKDIVKDKLSLTATTNNPFNKYRLNKTHIFGPGYDQNNISQQYFRSGNISMNYRFGKLKEAIKKNKRGISNDDVSN